MADRFHVIRLVNHHFLACWREIDAVAAKNRGLLSLMRRHRHNLKPEQKLRLMAYLADRPALNVIYRFKQRLCYLLLKKHKSKRQCQKLIPRFLRAIVELRQSGLMPLVALGETLHSWSQEIARMWRFTRSNGITEGFHNKMETISRPALWGAETIKGRLHQCRRAPEIRSPESVNGRRKVNHSACRGFTKNTERARDPHAALSGDAAR